MVVGVAEPLTRSCYNSYMLTLEKKNQTTEVIKSNSLFPHIQTLNLTPIANCYSCFLPQIAFICQCTYFQPSKIEMKLPSSAFAKQHTSVRSDTATLQAHQDDLEIKTACCSPSSQQRFSDLPVLSASPFNHLSSRLSSMSLLL